MEKDPGSSEADKLKTQKPKERKVTINIVTMCFKSSLFCSDSQGKHTHISYSYSISPRNVLLWECGKSEAVCRGQDLRHLGHSV